jgi:hypothetical protein
MVMVGINSAAPSRPTIREECVSWYICQGRTTKLIIEPKKEMVWLVKRRL